MNLDHFVYFIAATIIAALSGLGIGSGGLLIIMLTSFLGTDPLFARGMNLLFFVFSATAAFLVHYKRRSILIGPVIFASIFSILGTVAGSVLGSYMSPLLLRRVFGVILVLSGAKNLITATPFKKKKA